MNFRVFLLGLAALLVAFNAAFFSVTGLSKLFAGASTAVILMAGALEFSKLVAASFLHTYWDKLSGWLKFYLTGAVVTLILITSAGIYGFLTAAYQTTADELKIIDQKVSVLELKKDRFQTQLDSYSAERGDLTESITELTRGLSNNVIQYTDTLGNVITTTSSATRRVLTQQLDDAKEQRDLVSKQIEITADSLSNIDIQIIELNSNTDLAAEIGPLRYVSEITNQPMNKIVNWFALLIVFVFDPLAVTMVVAFNQALKINKGESDKEKAVEGREVYGETPNVKFEDISKLNHIKGIYDEEEFVDDDEEEPNEELKQAAERYKETQKEVEEPKPTNPLDNLKKDTSRRGIDLDGDGTIDGYDTDGDGLIDEPAPASSKRAQYAVTERPFYAKPNFNWGDTSKWINNQNAVNYYLTFIKNKKDSSRYPTNFDSKTY